MPSLEIVKKLADKHGVNTDVIPISILHKAVNIELEHRDLIGNNPEAAFMIAMAHLREYPDYYQRLIKMEGKADQFWQGKVKPNIYNGARTQATKVRIARTSSETVGPKRAARDLYGVRKSARKRRVTHIYPDYIPKQTPGQDKRKDSQPKAKGHASRRATEDRGFQTLDNGPEDQQ
jgi:hypothetical protein